MDPIVEQAVSQAPQTDAVCVERGALAKVGTMVTTHMPGRTALIVADERTMAAAGQSVLASLTAAGVAVAEPIVFPGTPTLYASLDNARSIAAAITAADEKEAAPVVPVAVGAGTLNDLVKLAAKQTGRRYVVVGTAASMDGYTGSGAPISDQGVKVTLDCTAPQVVIFDLDVAAAAPASMVASGYGDLSAKIPGGADWIVADALGVEEVDPQAWRLVQTGVTAALSQPASLAAGEPGAYEGLVNGLLLSGLAMQVYGGTRPASGAEHYFSHIWELAHLGAELDPPLSHGAKVAIGTLAMLGFYESFLARDVVHLDIDSALSAWPSWPQMEADIHRHFSGALADHAARETRTKYLPADQLRKRLQRLVEVWPSTRERLSQQLVPATTLQDQLRLAGAPSHPEQIGLTVEQVRRTFPKAMYYRSRYTVLDVAHETGWFDELVDQTFAPGRLWS